MLDETTSKDHVAIKCEGLFVLCAILDELKHGLRRKQIDEISSRMATCSKKLVGKDETIQQVKTVLEIGINTLDMKS